MLRLRGTVVKRQEVVHVYFKSEEEKIVSFTFTRTINIRPQVQPLLKFCLVPLGKNPTTTFHHIVAEVIRDETGPLILL